MKKFARLGMAAMVIATLSGTAYAHSMRVIVEDHSVTTTYIDTLLAMLGLA